MGKLNASNELKKIDEIFSDPKFKGVSQENRKELVQLIMSMSVSKTHSGPLPDVETLEGYDRIIPNGGERLMQQVEKQSEHRRKLESSVVKWNNIQSFMGQLFGLIVAMGFLYVTYLLAMGGHDTVASILGGTTIVGLVSVFVYGKKKQSEDFNQ